MKTQDNWSNMREPLMETTKRRNRRESLDAKLKK